MKTALLIAATSLISSISIAQNRVEAIFGYLPTKTGIVFQVSSGGCTHKQDFGIATNREPSTGVASVTLVRMHQDSCLPFMPMGTRISLTYKQLGLTPGERFIVNNPNGVVQIWVWPVQGLN